MSWQLNLYTLSLIVSALVSGAIAVHARRPRPATGAGPLALLMLRAAEWSLGYAIGMGFRDLASRIFWAKMQHLGIAVVPLAALAPQWLADLRQATLEGDLKWMETLIVQIREQHPALADRLRELADNFEHDVFLQLIQHDRWVTPGEM